MLWSIQLPFGTSLQGKNIFFFFFLVKKRSGCTLYMLGVVVAVVVVVVVAVEFSDVRQALYTCSKSAPRLAPQETLTLSSPITFSIVSFSLCWLVLLQLKDSCVPVVMPCPMRHAYRAQCLMCNVYLLVLKITSLLSTCRPSRHTVCIFLFPIYPPLYFIFPSPWNH